MAHTKRTVGDIWLGLFIAWLIAIGMLFFIPGPRKILDGSKAYHWQKHTGRIFTSSLEQVDDTTAVLTVTVGYTFNDADYEATRKLTDEPDYLKDQAQLFLKPGEDVLCRINPDNPAEMMLDKEYIMFEFFLIMSICITVIILLLCIGWSLWIRWRNRDAAEKVSLFFNKALIVFGCVFVLFFCGIATVRYIGEAVKAFGMLGWTRMEATIQTCEATKVPNGQSWDWQEDFSYTYTVDGQPYTGHIWALKDDEVSTSGKKRQAMAIMKVGDTVTCYVNPADPTQVVLERRLWSYYGILPMSGLLFVCAWFLWTTLSEKKQPSPSFKLSFEGDPDALENMDLEDLSPQQLTDIPFELHYELNRRQRLIPHLHIWPYWPVIILVILIVPMLLASKWWFIFLVPIAAIAVKGFFIGIIDVTIHPKLSMDIVVEKDRLGVRHEKDYRYQLLGHIIWMGKYEKNTWTVRFGSGIVINIPDTAITDAQALYIKLAPYNESESEQSEE